MKVSLVSSLFCSPANCSNSRVTSAQTENLKMYATVNDVGDVTDRDLKRLGVRSITHRQKMLNSLLGVRAKRRQSMNLEGKWRQLVNGANLYSYS